MRYLKERGTVFSLQKGMADEELLSVLYGNISGETQETVQQFYNIDKALQKFLNHVEYPTFFHNFETVACDTIKQYAIIVKKMVSGSVEYPRYFTQYFLVGMNDDDKYFLHELQNTPNDIEVAIEAGDMKYVIAWVNKHDLGFERRIQGDILIQYSKLFSGVLCILKNKCHMFLSNKIGYKTSFGRHILSTDNVIYLQDLFSYDHRPVDADRYYVVTGSQLILEHPEHKTVTEKIPEGYVAVLTNQRGSSQIRQFD